GFRAGPAVPRAGPVEAGMSGVHLFRPEWLWLLALLPVLAFGWWRRRRRARAWEDAVDPHLLAHLLERGEGRGGRASAAAALLAFLVAVAALAGPSWRQVAQPLWQGGMPLVVAMELSPAMLAADLPPSRLARALDKLSSLLAGREGGQVVLGGFGAASFTESLHPDDLY